MNLPGLNRGALAADAASGALAETQTKAVGRKPGVALSTRAVVVVALAGAGFWYLLWKLALYLIDGR